MKVTPKSSMIAHYEYDEKKGELTVHFHRGKPYTYQGVPRSLVDEMGAADSVGRFFLARVKGHF